MRLSRRQLVGLGVAGVVAATALVPALDRGIRRRAERTILTLFGPELEGTEVLEQFLADLETHLEKEQGLKSVIRTVYFSVVPDAINIVPDIESRFDDMVFKEFAKSTNVIAHYEFGAKLTYFGFYHGPYESPCLAVLGSDFAV
jgi:hypothetical protein